MVKENKMNKRTDYTKPKPVAESKEVKEPVKKNKIGVVTAEKLNVRKDPEKGDNVIKVINKGTRVVIRKELPGWYRIQFDNKFGFVMSEFIVIEEE